MIREIVRIDRELCNGCGVCIPNCHEGALQMIDGKATLVSELMCDGLGACLGHCPVNAITIEKREAADYDEVAVVKEMIPHGKNVMIAHLKHLKEHDQIDFLKQGVKYLKENQNGLPYDLTEVIEAVHQLEPKAQAQKHQFAPIVQPKHEGHHGGSCPGSREMSFAQKPTAQQAVSEVSLQSELRQWPIQMHLINPMAAYFRNADLVLAADCVAFAMGDFHQTWLKGKSLAIACPKLDSNKEVYIEKIIGMIDNAKINTITVMMMEVPCCGGLMQMVEMARQSATRKVPVKQIIVSLQGEILTEEWA